MKVLNQLVDVYTLKGGVSIEIEYGYCNFDLTVGIYYRLGEKMFNLRGWGIIMSYYKILNSTDRKIILN